ncbi:MAG: peptidylprolyl isomerase [Paraglaciecola chathamensis]
MMLKLKHTAMAIGISCLTISVSHATEVQIRTVLGDVNINLFDNTTPQTVENFLSYVNSGAYANNIVHRSEPGFVIQAGAFQYNTAFPLDSVPTGSAVENEPELSNRRGTIAMAKLSGNPDSATSQWFINLSDNSANLDVQNGGFTVFGQVLGDGMDIIDQIAALNRFDLGGAANATPLRNYSQADLAAGVDVTDEHLVIITDVVVTDAATVTHAELNPPANTLINQDNSGGGSSGGSGGSVGLFGLLGLAVLRFTRNWYKLFV